MWISYDINPPGKKLYSPGLGTKYKEELETELGRTFRQMSQGDSPCERFFCV